MPKTKRVKRKAVRLPDEMLAKVKELVEYFPELHYTSLSFVESAVREKIEKLMVLVVKNRRKSEESQASDE